MTWGWPAISKSPHFSPLLLFFLLLSALSMRSWSSARRKARNPKTPAGRSGGGGGASYSPKPSSPQPLRAVPWSWEARRERRLEGREREGDREERREGREDREWRESTDEWREGGREAREELREGRGGEGSKDIVECWSQDSVV